MMNEETQKNSLSITVVYSVALVLCTMIGIIIWAVSFPISGAVVATGKIMPSNKIAQIQHAYGGNIVDIVVKEGDFVNKDEILIILDAENYKSNDDYLTKQLIFLNMRSNLLKEELKNLNTKPYRQIEVSKILEDNSLYKNNITNSFLKYKILQAEQRSQLFLDQLRVTEHTVKQLKEESNYLEDQIIEINNQINLYSKILNSYETLHSNGVMPTNTLLSSELDYAELREYHVSKKKDLSNIENNIVKTEIEFQNYKNKLKEEITNEILETENEINTLNQELYQNQLVLDNLKIRSPIDGYVASIEIPKSGGYVQPGNNLLKIIPEFTDFIVEAQIGLNDIDSVYRGMEGNINLNAYPYKSQKPILGFIADISSDTVKNEGNNTEFYKAILNVPKNEIDKLTDRVDIINSMEVTVFLKTSPRTFWQYIMSSVLYFKDNSLNE